MARNTFDVDETLEKEFNWSHYKRLGAYIKPYKKAVFKTLFVIILANLASMLGPYFTKIAIDQVIPQKNLSLLLILGAIFLFSLVIIGWCMRYRIYAITEIGQDILKDMRFSIFEHLQKLPFSYFDSRPHGKILIRVVNYINTLSDLLSNGLINLISDLFNVIITLIFMLFIDVKLTLYSLLLLPVLFVMVLFIQGKQRKAYQELSNKQSNLNAYIHESISGIKITQSFAREDENFQIFNEVSEEYRQSFMKAVRVQYLLWPAVQNISVITTCFIYFVGIRQLGVSVTTGTLIAFIGYINNFWNPVINIGNFYNSLITATAYYETVVEERGSTLSAGQRQLISFARALLADPKILILDEATSSIDTKTEELLQEGLQQLLKGRTSFIIAHRLSTIKNSDKIFYIDGGRIVEEGSHDQLMAKHALYHHLYQSQYDLLKS